jgi:hypothetical protein
VHVTPGTPDILATTVHLSNHNAKEIRCDALPFLAANTLKNRATHIDRYAYAICVLWLDDVCVSKSLWEKVFFVQG